MSINVCTETYDAITNGAIATGEDITAALQECFTYAGTTVDWGNDIVIRYEDPYIPFGGYLISDTILVPHKTGFSLRGQGGIGQSTADNPTYRASRTVLRWNGEDGGTMFEVRGKYIKFFDLTFRGTNSAETTTASVGILVTKGGQTNISTGWMNVDRCSFFEFSGYGAQLGAFEGEGENNCEKVIFTDCLFDDCTLGALKNSGSQQLGNAMVRCAVQGATENAVYTTGGGKFYSKQMHLLGGAGTRRLFKADYVTKGFGANNGDFTFEDTIIDNQVGTKAIFTLAEVNTGNVKLTFARGQQSCFESPGFFDYDGVFCKLTNNSSVAFNNFNATFRDMVGVIDEDAGGDGTPFFQFRDCLCFDGAPHLQLSGSYEVEHSGCRTPSNTRITDYPERAVYIDGELFSPSNGSIGDIVVH